MVLKATLSELIKREKRPITSRLERAAVLFSEKYASVPIKNYALLTLYFRNSGVNAHDITSFFRLSKTNYGRFSASFLQYKMNQLQEKYASSSISDLYEQIILNSLGSRT